LICIKFYFLNVKRHWYDTEKYHTIYSEIGLILQKNTAASVVIYFAEMF